MSTATIIIIKLYNGKIRGFIMKAVKRFFLNAIILTFVSLAMRLIALVFNVYVSNKIGAEAIGLFALISSVYGFALTVATSGINLASTRLCAEAISKNNQRELTLSMRKCIVFSLCFSIFAALAMLFGADYIGREWLDDTRTISALKILALTLPPIALSSAMSGYFTAVRRVYKSALTQFAGQGIKIFLTISLLTVFLPKGIEHACIALVLGGAFGEFISFSVMLSLWFIDKNKNKLKKEADINSSALTKRLLGISLPVALSAYARSALVTIEHILIPVGLRKYGATKETALASYGILHSMVLPITLFPAAVLASFSSLIIPEITECNTLKNDVEIKYISSRVYQFSLAFAIGVCGIILCFSNQLSAAIYPNSKFEVARYLRYIAPLIPVMYIDSATDAILKGLGQQVYCMNVNIIDALLSVVLVLILIPRMGIIGYVITIYFTELINASLSIARLLKIGKMKLRFFKWLISPVIAVVGATTILRIILHTFSSSCLTCLPNLSSDGSALYLALWICLCTVFYIVLLRMLCVIDKEDIQWLRGVFKQEKVIKSGKVKIKLKDIFEHT